MLFVHWLIYFYSISRFLRILAFSNLFHFAFVAHIYLLALRSCRIVLYICISVWFPCLRTFLLALRCKRLRLCIASTLLGWGLIPVCLDWLVLRDVVSLSTLLVRQRNERSFVGRKIQRFRVSNSSFDMCSHFASFLSVTGMREFSSYVKGLFKITWYSLPSSLAVYLALTGYVSSVKLPRLYCPIMLATTFNVS